MKTSLLAHFAVLFGLTLSGCNTPEKPHDPVLLPETKVVEIPEYLLEECPSLAKLTAPKYNEGESVEAVKTWVNTVDDCRTRHRILSGLVRKAFNTPNAKVQPSK